MGTGTDTGTGTGTTDAATDELAGGRAGQQQQQQLGGLNRPKHRALRFTVCMEEEVTLTLPHPSLSASLASSSYGSVPNLITSSSLRNTSFDLCLSDMTYRFDPTSVWFQHFPAIFDPIGSTDIIPTTTTTTTTTTTSDSDGDIPASSTSSSSSSSPAVSVFGRTRLHLSVNKLLVDCCQPDRTEEVLRHRLSLTHQPSSSSPSSASYEEKSHSQSHGHKSSRQGKKGKHHQHHQHSPPADSRILLSLGGVSVSSTLVTNSNRVALSASVSDASVRVSNKLLRTPRHLSADTTTFTSSSRGERIVGPISRCLEQSPVDICGYYIEETYQQSGGGGGTGTAAGPGGQSDLTIDFDSFVDVHGLVLMGALDRCGVKIHLNTPSLALAAASHSVF